MKKILWALGILILLSVLSIFLVEKWLVKTLPEKINAKEDRDYDILFEDVNLQLFRGSIVMQDISLRPLKDSMPTTITGTMKSVRLGEVNMLGLIFGDVLDIGELRLEVPQFVLIRNDSISKKPADVSIAFQDFFGDLISRGVIHNFILNDGSGEFYTQSDSLRKFGSFDSFNISAVNLETDSVQLNYAIPFKLESIETRLKNLQINLDKEQTFTLGELNYDSKEDAFDFFDLKLAYDDTNLAVAKRSDIQKDYIEISLKHLKIENINARSSIYGNWSIVAGLMTIDSLILHDLRNQNKPRPIDEPEKTMFEGMVEMIPFPLEVDTIRVLNSQITYSQISKGKSQPGSLKFEQLSALVTHVVSTDSLQSGEMFIHGEAVLNGFAPLRMDVTVPYGKKGKEEQFHLEASIDPFGLPSLNGILGDLVSVNINSGTMEKLEITMDANPRFSSNFMKFHYKDLKLELRDEEDKKKKLISTLANVAMSSNNLPENRNYKTATFRTERNIYRGTFNLIWESLREGMLEIVPGNVMQLFLGEQDPSDGGKRR
ncbi:AsmA family protein [Algoriphagus antarcticus]|uniref:DUF748 domain-containing protein n=1 Tax=Algoriphagus antarcticus TaxID=238540 RepID=A0A3E0DNL6_9BACT|nr:hypothetical protein [Algoriphagus antarcticus]REG83397.1 hypothetical protein C8N25_11842 [Algoriphagus antarcticus]